MNLVPAHEYYPESRDRPKIFCLKNRTLTRAVRFSLTTA